jgi:hypothetical protein
MEQDENLDLSITCSSPVHGEPMACSEPPAVHKDDARDDAFKGLLLTLSHKMSQDNTGALAFTAECNLSAGPLTALDVLQAMMRKGVFSARSCGGLEEHLRRIERCDLAELVHSFREKYPELPPRKREQ